MFRKTFLAGVTFISMGCAFAVQAEELDKPMFSVSGFGTIGVTRVDEGQADFTSNVLLKANGAGYSHQWSPHVDSKIGAQVSANFTPQLSAVLQVVSQQRYDNTYLPTVEWANFKYHVTPDLSIRVGRIALSAFLDADYRNVGYALPWVRAAGEVYNLLPITNSDGVDLTYRTRIGSGSNTFKASYGQTDIKYRNNGQAQARAIFGFSDTAEYGPASVRLSYLTGVLNSDVAQPLFSAFKQLGPRGTAIADRYDVDGKRLSVVALGANYDPGEWFVTGEIAKSMTHSFIGNKTAWYAGAGYRIDKFTPYLTVAQVRATSNTSDPGLSVVGLPPQLAGVASGMNAGLNDLLGSVGVQKSAAVGLRWDFAKSVDVKLQFERIVLGANSAGNLIQIQPDFRRGGTVNTVSAVLDFVF